jgi:hypothetical protein
MDAVEPEGINRVLTRLTLGDGPVTWDSGEPAATRPSKRGGRELVGHTEWWRSQRGVPPLE